MSFKCDGNTPVDWKIDLNEYLRFYFEGVGSQQLWRSSH